MRTYLKLGLLLVAALAVSLPFQWRGRHRLYARDVQGDLIAIDAAKEQYAVREKAPYGAEVPGTIDDMVKEGFLNDPPQTGRTGTFTVHALGAEPTFAPHVAPRDAGLPLHLTEAFSALPSDLSAVVEQPTLVDPTLVQKAAEEESRRQAEAVEATNGQGAGE